MKFIKSNKYDKSIIKKHMMGPNSMKILEEMMENIQLSNDMRVLDLGCGRGLTSVFLAKEYDVQVFAVDLWISATENFDFFKNMGMDRKIIPIHSDALSLPFAENYFDAVISVDAYHYFGSNDSYYDEYLSKCLRDDAQVAIAVPGMKYELHDNVPEEMKQYWPEEALVTWHSVSWWDELLKKSKHFKIEKIEEIQCFDESWKDWLETDNEYAIGDRGMIKTDNNRFMNLVSIIGRNKLIKPD